MEKRVREVGQVEAVPCFRAWPSVKNVLLMPLCAAQMQKGKPGYNHTSPSPSPSASPSLGSRPSPNPALGSARIGPSWLGLVHVLVRVCVCVHRMQSATLRAFLGHAVAAKRRPQFAMPHRRNSPLRPPDESCTIRFAFKSI